MDNREQASGIVDLLKSSFGFGETETVLKDSVSQQTTQTNTLDKILDAVKKDRIIDLDSAGLVDTIKKGFSNVELEPSSTEKTSIFSKSVDSANSKFVDSIKTSRDNMSQLMMSEIADSPLMISAAEMGKGILSDVFGIDKDPTVEAIDTVAQRIDKMSADMLNKLNEQTKIESVIRDIEKSDLSQIEKADKISVLMDRQNELSTEIDKQLESQNNIESIESQKEEIVEMLSLMNENVKETKDSPELVRERSVLQERLLELQERQNDLLERDDQKKDKEESPKSFIEKIRMKVDGIVKGITGALGAMLVSAGGAIMGLTKWVGGQLMIAGRFIGTNMKKMLIKSGKMMKFAGVGMLGLAIVTSIDNIFDGVKKSWQESEGDGVGSRILQAMIGGFAGLGEGLLEFVGIEPEEVQKLGASIGSFVYDTIQDISGWFSEKFDAVKGIASGVGQYISNMSDNIKNAITSPMSETFAVISEKFGKIKDDAITWLNDNAPWVMDFGTHISKKIGESLENLTNLITGAFNFGSDWLQTNYPSVYGIGKTIIDSVMSPINFVRSRLLGTVDDITKMWDDGVSIGDVFGMMVSKITGVFDWIANLIPTMFDNLLASFSDSYLLGGLDIVKEAKKRKDEREQTERKISLTEKIIVSTLESDKKVLTLTEKLKEPKSLSNVTTSTKKELGQQTLEKREDVLRQQHKDKEKSSEKISTSAFQQNVNNGSTYNMSGNPSAGSSSGVANTQGT